MRTTIAPIRTSTSERPCSTRQDLFQHIPAIGTSTLASLQMTEPQPCGIVVRAYFASTQTWAILATSLRRSDVPDMGASTATEHPNQSQHSDSQRREAARYGMVARHLTPIVPGRRRTAESIVDLFGSTHPDSLTSGWRFVDVAPNENSTPRAASSIARNWTRRPCDESASARGGGRGGQVYANALSQCLKEPYSGSARSGDNLGRPFDARCLDLAQFIEYGLSRYNGRCHCFHERIGGLARVPGGLLTLEIPLRQ